MCPFLAVFVSVVETIRKMAAVAPKAFRFNIGVLGGAGVGKTGLLADFRVSVLGLCVFSIDETICVLRHGGRADLSNCAIRN